MELLIINLIVISMAGFVFFYVRSVRTAQMEKELGVEAYPGCARLRYIAFAFLIVNILAEVAYRYYPLFGGSLLYFNAPWIYPAIIGLLLAIPGTIIIKMASDAAELEAYRPAPETILFGGIYEKMRHPMAVGDTLTILALGFLLNSPFLVLFNLLWIPLFIYISREEEKDLLIRFGNDYEQYMKKTGFYFPKK